MNINCTICITDDDGDLIHPCAACMSAEEAELDDFDDSDLYGTWQGDDYQSQFD